MLSISLAGYTQKQDLIQLSGVIRNELLQPLQFTHILIKNQHRGTISDQKGMFSFIVEPYDTILFSSVGYKRVGLIIPDTLKTFHLELDIYMETDTIMIEEVIILPWKTYEEFKEAFLALELPDNDMNRAYKNIALIKTQIYYSGTPDPGLNYKYMLQEQYNELYTKGQMPYYSIFNPIRWAEFFKYLEEGKFKNKNR
ncbi:MAG: carboxypeptidase-like regulatory domain-containing protein [Bacteroidales bacterium]|nr:carboxypeptidase-like regulatory domain-containing protein [Bacteroidales bacterium]